MTGRLRKLREDERGMFLVFAGLGFMGFLICATLAIDVGMFMNARSEAQNSADAGALAGAVALVFDNYADRTSSGKGRKRKSHDPNRSRSPGRSAARPPPAR